MAEAGESATPASMAAVASVMRNRLASEKGAIKPHGCQTVGTNRGRGRVQVWLDRRDLSARCIRPGGGKGFRYLREPCRLAATGFDHSGRYADRPAGARDQRRPRAGLGAKEFLGPRRASVFLVPSRRAVSMLVKRSMLINKATGGFAPVAREASDPRRAPSIQAYSIFPRIQQIDQMLRQDKRCAGVFSSCIPRSRLP
jgi:hypothetical protein